VKTNLGYESHRCKPLGCTVCLPNYFKQSFAVHRGEDQQYPPLFPSPFTPDEANTQPGMKRHAKTRKG